MSRCSGRSGRLSLLVLSGLLLPLSASAQSTTSVSPTSFTLQTIVGANTASQSMQVRNTGNRAVKWSVVAPAVTWLTVSPSNGRNAATIALTFNTSALPAGVYRTSFRIDSTASRPVTVPVQVTTVAPPPPVPGLVVSCPANASAASPDGLSLVVSYSAKVSGGTPPVAITGSPASGTAFPIGTTPVTVRATSTDGQTASCGFTLTVTYTAPPVPTTAIGPQATITCPAGAVDIYPGIDIQGMVNANAGSTTFCLKAGVHRRASSIRPKTGNTFVGEYGAIMDGTGWTTTDDTQGAFRAHNENIDDVTIRNLVIRKMPQRGVHSYPSGADNWTVEYNEITGNVVGVVVPNNSLIRNNFIHHNVGDPTSQVYVLQGGGYQLYQSHNVVFENNEISYNGVNQKVVDSVNITFRNNFVHHNLESGIWYDGDNIGSLIEGNTVEDHPSQGIFYEVSGQGVIRNNTVRRSGDSGIFVSTSRDLEIYGNTLEANFRGINAYLSCDRVYPPGQPYPTAIGADLRNLNIHDNATAVGMSPAGSFSSLFSQSCTGSFITPYLDGSKNLTWTHNTYSVPNSTGNWWYWAGGTSWSLWQAGGHDTTGTSSPLTSAW